jgi:lipopolysaccharide transport system ATP-binding protein
MSKPIIEVKGISKCYKLGSIGASTMRDEVEALFARFKKTKPLDPSSPENSPLVTRHSAAGAAATSSNQPLATSHSLPNSARSAEFWALRDVSFDVQPGEVVGIIGRNGAGKSTLLKILSRITEPTSGEIRVRGRIASLLEVGTGFHPELSGRENIFLNGAILGMTKAEIRAKFDEIVDFAGVEQFIDTPVKRYSSGMYVRLAFAVAAHLEPEILILDEVLAVGDAEFQKKCLGKMKDVSSQGRTVLFVSHNMTSLQALCDRAIFLENGKAFHSGSVHEAVALYLHGQVKEDSPVYDVIEFPKDADAIIDRIRILDSEGRPSLRFRTSEPWHIEIQWKNLAGIPVNPNIQLKTNTDVTALIALDVTLDWDGWKKAAPGSYVSKVTMPPHFLNGNEYKLSVALDSGSPRKFHHGATDFLTITLWDPMDETSLARGFFSTPREDVIVWPALNWTCQGPQGEIK